MSDGSLSQDEIDALLQGTEEIISDGGLNGGSSNISVMTDSPLSQTEYNSFKNLLNTAASNEGEALGAMIGRNVSISNPSIEAGQLSDLQGQLPDEIVEVKMDYDTGIIGEHLYILDVDSAKIIAGLMMGQEGGDLTEASLSAIGEAMNTISGNASTTIGNKIKKEIRTAPPVFEIKSKNEISISSSNKLILVTYDFSIEGDKRKLYEIFGVNAVKEITASVVPATNEMPDTSTTKVNKQSMMGQQTMQQMNVGQTKMKQNPQVQNVQFANFSDISAENQAGNINLLMDVTMDLTVELGRTKKTIKYILGMGEGTVLELDKLAGEPVDILVNGKLIARGEVVVIDENFGVRVTEIISPADRIQELT